MALALVQLAQPIRHMFLTFLDVVHRLHQAMDQVTHPFISLVHKLKVLQPFQLLQTLEVFPTIQAQTHFLQLLSLSQVDHTCQLKHYQHYQVAQHPLLFLHGSNAMRLL